MELFAKDHGVILWFFTAGGHIIFLFSFDVILLFINLLRCVLRYYFVLFYYNFCFNKLEWGII